MLLLSFIFISLFVALLGWLLYLLYKPFRNRWLKSGKLTPQRSIIITKVYKLALFLFAIFQTYIANYPPDSFYFNELESVTLKEPPPSAEIVKKASSYPDFHGDYCSVSLIKFSKEDYTRLYNELQSDKDLIKNPHFLSSEVSDKVFGRNEREQIKHSFKRKNLDNPGLHLYIGFLDDGQTIVVNKCSS